jgi:hypothetical protein
VGDSSRPAVVVPALLSTDHVAAGRPQCGLLDREVLVSGADACVPDDGHGHAPLFRLALPNRYKITASAKSALADKQLEAKVRAALVENFGSGDMAAIRVVAVNGKIVLDGVTSAGGLGTKAEKLAREIEGVNDIENCIISVPSHGRPNF